MILIVGKEKEIHTVTTESQDQSALMVKGQPKKQVIYKNMDKEIRKQDLWCEVCNMKGHSKNVFQNPRLS